MRIKAGWAIFLVALGVLGVVWSLLSVQTGPVEDMEDDSALSVGSAGCQGCHAGFYEKWATSWHGLALRPYTPAFARETLTPLAEPLEIRGRRYSIDLDGEKGILRESGPEGDAKHPIEHVVGGKNVVYFLTPFPGGRLQVLPLAYDVRSREWYDTTGSMVRHFNPGGDAPLEWTDRLLTFNAACFNCHVSSLEKNYAPDTDSYTTRWSEPGIACEACHGPGGKHIRAARLAPEGKLEDLQIISTKSFGVPAMNSLCAPCHAKMSPLGGEPRPGEDFFDHFNIACLEDRDFSPDGKDLGENYTYTAWLMSPCAASGRLDCNHCHTSGGRWRHPDPDSDRACLPCHEALVKDAAAHSHHPEGSEGARCIACHMPRTSFARMRRHDHSMLAPAPAASIRFGSPNACNLCHTDKDAHWADELVRAWYPRDYQEPLLARATLVDLARKEDWSRLEDTAAYIASAGRNEVFAASLLRLLEPCPLDSKWSIFFEAIRNSSPLVRSSAAAGLAGNPTEAGFEALLAAAQDPVRVVRVQAGAALVRWSIDALEPPRRDPARRAIDEYKASLEARPDDPTSHYNLGNFHQDRGDFDGAAASYHRALKLRAGMIPTLVNLAIVEARRGEPAKAEEALVEALKAEPANSEANFNLALLRAEQGRIQDAEDCLRKALETDPRFAEAAYNLGLLVFEEKPEECIALLRKAAELRPDETRYAYTLAFQLDRSGDREAALAVLRPLHDRHPDAIDAFFLLGRVLETTERKDEAAALYREGIQSGILPPHASDEAALKLEAIEGR